ncbi:hypothetical protein [Anaerobacillus sp. 1_MG-2023]|uniref:hypothetical protein n=1 Tax=Anaerobacillus sp. 1_MG-2023 TaxID=3062655 RepID=UPI0026E3FF99|nr:hypothetical protein [Anaerobacillus sp. 1_MG-2023]MDO6654780.1 hypothetical protein [Anaerobacillus sp. 1_MG-2023]
MKENEKSCPECGEKETRIGEFTGYGSLFKKKGFAKSSPVDASFCVNCGTILSLKVRNPKKFI